jgi:hypothetical protein
VLAVAARLVCRSAAGDIGRNGGAQRAAGEKEQDQPELSRAGNSSNRPRRSGTCRAAARSLCERGRSSARRRDVRLPPPAERIAECRIDWDALGPQPEKRPSLGEPKWVALLRQAATHRLSLSVLRLSDRITRQRVGSTQQLVLHGTRWGSSARVCGGLRKHAFEIHKSLGQGCVQIGDLAVQLGRGHEQFACLVDGVRQLHGRPGDRISWDGALLGQDGSGV